MADPTHPPGFGVTVDDVRAYDWVPTGKGESRECCQFHGGLSETAKALSKSGETRGVGVYGLLPVVDLRGFYGFIESLEPGGSADTT